MVKLKKILTETCIGKQTCDFKLPYTDFWFGNSTYPQPPPNTIFFASVVCEAMSQEYLDLKKIWGYVCSTIGVFMCIFFWLSIRRYSKRNSQEKETVDLV